MRLIKLIIAMAMAWVTVFVHAGDSASMVIDLRVEPCVDKLAISWDASWIGGNASANVVIKDNGTEVKRTTGSGTFTHTLSGGGRHELTYTTYIGSVAQAEIYTATVYQSYCVVAFAANGGSVNEANRNVKTNNAIGTLPAPARTGYTFAGWWTSASGGTQISASTTVTGNVTYYAHWTVNQYTVTFNANGGTGGKSGKQNYGSAIVAPTVTRTGYTFKNWSPSVAATVPASNVTYTAQWQANTYSVTLDRQSGSGGTASITATYGSAMPSITVPTRTGYTFGGYWTGTNGSGTQYYTAIGASARTWDKTSAMTLYAKWTINQYTVTFDANGGTGGMSGKQDYGSAIVAPTVTRTGYTFKSWSPSVATTVPASNVTYTAQWQINQYTVTFDANGGTGGKSGKQDYGSAIVAPTVTREGYTFTGWSSSVAATVPANDVIYTAQWQANTYSVTLDCQCGVGGTTSVTVIYGSTMPSITVPTCTGYTFDGYWTDTNGNGTQYYTASGISAHTWDKTSVTTLYAKWTAKTYTVNFDRQSGSGGTSSVTAKYGSVMPSITVPTRVGYTFGGYYTSTDGIGTQYYTSSGASARTWDKTSATTLYAKWMAKTYTVNLNQQSGSGGTASVTATYGSAMPSITVPTRTGYTFGGYYTSTGGSGTQYYTASGASARTWDKTSATTLYAKWTAKTYTVNFDQQSGNGGTASVTATYGSAMPSITVPTRTGYTFGGYYTSTGGGGMQYYTASGAGARTWDKTSATTLYAKWTINQYTVTFNANGGTGGKSVKQDYESVIVAPTVTRTGYTFKSWSPSVAATVPANDVTYTAQWQINQYTVTFDANGGTGGKSGKQDYGSAIVAPMVTREGYTFTGWSPSVAATVPANDVTYTAQWYGTPTVTDVVAKQRYPWNGLVDITCKVTGISGTDQWKFSVAAVMPDTGNARKVSQFWVVKNGANSTDKKVQANGNYHLLWDASADLGQVTCDNMVMRVTVELHDMVQLWEGGPYWADTNIGAENPEDYGYYFWWGDTVGYTRSGGTWDSGDSIYRGVTWVSSAGQQMSSSPFASSSCPTYNKSNSALQSAGWIDSTGNLVPAHDAAHVHWGGGWRMPTDAEFLALFNNCTTTWTTRNGVYGRLVTGKGAYANRSIFLPAAGYGYGSFLERTGSYGYCWSSTPGSDYSDIAWSLYFFSDRFSRLYGYYRYSGQSVRPVRGFAQ